MKFVKPEVANDRTVFPNEEDMKKMNLPAALSNDSRRTMTRIYTTFKTGL
jgi:putrescine transport system substrate-binding protein